MKIKNNNFVFIFVILTILLYAHSSQGYSQLNQSSNGDLQISLDIEFKVIKTGDTFQFNTFVTNLDSENTPRLIVAMNIVNLKDGSIVDPEDWSPQRKQFVSSLSNGTTSKQRWTVHAIIKGDYMVYMVVIPIPDGQTETSIPVSSSAIHLTVSPFTRLNPGGILLIAITLPTVLIVIYFTLRRRRRSQIDLE